MARRPVTLDPGRGRRALVRGGTADNKGQYCINVAALEQVLAERGGRLGFNARMLVECGEEVGSPGLHAACGQWRDALKADVFIASDGPRRRTCPRCS